MELRKNYQFSRFSFSYELMRSLIQAPYFEVQVIHDVAGEANLSRRLREMGFHAGCEVKILGRAPFNGPYVVQLHDSVLALRTTEAQCLLIK